MIGRAPEAALRLNDAAVSWRHASLRWTGSGWELQDLGSRNGTFLDGQRIDAGARVLLRLGARLSFGGGAQEWELVDADAPQAAAIALDDGRRIAPEGGLLVLPGSDEPELSIYQQPSGIWIAEAHDLVWELAPNEIVVAGGQRFRFEAGDALRATSATAANLPTPAAIALEFEVSRNEEQVDLALTHAGRRTLLRPRAHSYLLLTLARLRARDQSEGALPPSSHGWVEQSRLLKMLATTSAQLALDIYRARRQFNDAGVVDSAHIVERRPSSRELRIGVERLSIRVV